MIILIIILLIPQLLLEVIWDTIYIQRYNFCNTRIFTKQYISKVKNNISMLSHACFDEYITVCSTRLTV